MAVGFNKLDMMKPFLGAHEPTDDIEPARIDLRLPERLTHTGYNQSKR